MSISTPFIERPVATTLLLVAVTLAGAISYTLLPVAALPQVDFPTIQVSANLPGGSPEVMAAAVATPLEKQFTRIAGITEMTSRSTVGSAQVTLQFELSRDINAAARDVQAAITASAGFLPTTLPQLPRYRKNNPADQPILLMSLESDVVPRPQLYDIASSVFAQKLSQVQGVGQVTVGGSSLPAVRVEVNPQPLSKYNVGLDQIGTFLQQANAHSPKGALADANSTLPIYATDQLFLAKEYKDLVVVYRNGAPVRLSDLGRVIDANEDVRNLGIAKRHPHGGDPGQSPAERQRRRYRQAYQIADSAIPGAALLTLFTTPVIYLYLDGPRKRFSREHGEFRHRPGFRIPGGVAESAD